MVREGGMEGGRSGECTEKGRKEGDESLRRRLSPRYHTAPDKLLASQDQTQFSAGAVPPTSPFHVRRMD